jgi:glutathione S-transferase
MTETFRKSTPSKVLLYEHPASPYAQSVKIALREKGVDFVTQPPNDPTKGAPAPAFKSANPRLEVPAFIDGDLSLFETPVILGYIEDKWPSPSLFPNDPAKRAEMRLTGHVVMTQYEAVLWALGEIRLFKRAEGDLKVKIEKNAQQIANALQEWLTKRLGSSPYFSGSQFGYADLCVAPILNSSVNSGVGPAKGSPLYEWLTRVKERESVRKTFEEAMAGIRSMAGMGKLLKVPSGFKREYRDHRLDFIIRAGGIDVVVEGLKKDNIRFSWPDVARAKL